MLGLPIIIDPSFAYKYCVRQRENTQVNKHCIGMQYNMV